MSNAILEAVDLCKQFAGFTAVDRVNLSIAAGSIHAFIGPNGAGKTTCFNLLTKFLQPTSGVIRFKGRDITALKADDVARLGIVRSFQISSIFPHLTAFENVRIALQRRRGDSFDFWRSKSVLSPLAEPAHEIIADLGLEAFAQTRAAELPYGRKRALEFALTLALSPEVLLLDEPTAGMGAEDIDRVAALIKRISRGRTVVLVEHNLSVVANLSDRITVLARGRVLAEGDYQSIADNPEVRQVYLGSSHA